MHTYHNGVHKNNVCLFQFKNKQLYRIDRLIKKRDKDCTHADHKELDDPLPFKIIHIKGMVILS